MSTQRHVERRVFGPPGTGKSTFVARNVVRAAEKYGEKGVLVASFTNAAAKEIASRELGGVPDENVGTLHSLAYQAIGKPPLVFEKATLQQWNEDHPEFGLSAVRVSLDDPDKSVEAEGAQAGDEVFADYDRYRAKRTPRTLWAPSVLNFAQEWEAFKQETGTIDFTDMIEVALETAPRAPHAPLVGFFDEVQDFSRLELDLVRSWAEQMEYVVLAGDDDQAIYGFRGATPDAFLDPPLDPEYETVLSQSFRVPRVVHGLASDWVVQLERRKEKTYKARDSEGALWVSPAAFNDPRLLVDVAEDTERSGKEFLFLACTSFHLRETVKELRRRGIPFHNRWVPKRGDWNPLAKKRGTSSVDRLLSFLRPDSDIFGDDAPDYWPVKDLKAWSEIVRAEYVFVRGAKAEISKAPEVSFDQLKQWFKPEALEPALNLNIDWFESALLSEKLKPMTFPLAVLRARGPRGLLEEPKVSVSTIHGSKGGQADVVALYPDLSPAGYREWHSEERDRVVRQFYVGLTRAKETLVLARPGSPFNVRLVA